MTKDYPTEVLLSITTGILLCDFSAVHECCEFLMEEPIWTHQFAHEPLMEKLKSAVLCQHPQLSTVSAVGVDDWQEFRDRMIGQFGPRLPILPLRLCSKEELEQSFTEPLQGKKVIKVDL